MISSVCCAVVGSCEETVVVLRVRIAYVRVLCVGVVFAESKLEFKFDTVVSTSAGVASGSLSWISDRVVVGRDLSMVLYLNV